ncbi:hypothetical protein OEZ85_002873 [Tetradesmus obliquus]|uniref:Uncharacterized protein n=1 Tax=Tetradesmus obliquus TaxID=3088 RepID=A0ABY8TZN8_TETOB|nr:hypothetical protein OEZ85_002873 [Tetradesmus obliquus]
MLTAAWGAVWILLVSGVAVVGVSGQQAGRRFEPAQGYDAWTYTSTKGQRPGGLFSVGERAAANTGPVARGIRYNGGKVLIAGDTYPGPIASTNTGWGVQSRAGGRNRPMNAAAVITRAGNTPGEANINLGRQAIAAHTGSLGARAVAGSGVMHTAEEGATVSANLLLMTPRKVVNEGSVAFTDRAHNSAAVGTAAAAAAAAAQTAAAAAA